MNRTLSARAEHEVCLVCFWSLMAKTKTTR
ncbi:MULTISPECIES: hypothetical protein [Sinorhizobium]|nr:hypothetical protein [Sinorhizobium meliloti]UFX12569.1 hypothetical protein SmelRRI128_27910 [Sinorhizobium meliloti]